MAKKSQYQKNTKKAVKRMDLKGAPYNPRVINKTSAQRLRQSIRSHGLIGGIVWNKRTGNVVAGHQRLDQLDQLEGTDDYELTVDVIDVSPLEEKEINIALNNPTMQGDWNSELLGEVIAELNAEGRNVERTGFTANDLFELLGDVALEGEQAEQRDDEAPVLDLIEEVKQAGQEEKKAEEPVEDAEFEVKPPRDEEASGSTSPDDGDEETEAYDFNERRDEYVDETADDEDADVLVTLTFSNNSQREAFQRAFGLQPDKRYFDIYEIREAFGWQD